jgi:hypothetical protein
MKSIAPLWKPAVLAAATAVSLAFGAAQAFAAPKPADDGKSAAACPTYACPECGPLGGRWVPSAGRCYCCG